MTPSIRRTAARSLIGLTLAVGGLVGTGTITPAAHASPAPVISAQITQRLWSATGIAVHVSGTGFTPGGGVEVNVVVYRGPPWPNFLAQARFTASTQTVGTCSPFGGCSVSYPGSLSPTMIFPAECPSHQTYEVTAWDLATSVKSNVVQQSFGSTFC